MQQCHVMFLQEHWYMQKDLPQLCKNMSDVNIIGCSGMDETVLLMGRPYGGCAILFRKSLNWYVEIIDTESRRICACICKDPSGMKMLLCNLYLPCDVSSGTAASEFCSTIDEVSSIIAEHSDIDFVIVGGDLNTDFNRVRSVHVAPLREFGNRHSMRLCIDHPAAKVAFT